MKGLKINKAILIIFILIIIMVLQAITTIMLIAIERNMNKTPNPVERTEKVEVETENTTEICMENVTTQSISEAVTAEDFLKEETTEVTTEELMKETAVKAIEMDSEEAYISEKSATEDSPETYNESTLTPSKGVNYNSTGYKETYYNLPMDGVVDIMRNCGFDESAYPYWVREDGVKMLGDYVMVAANLDRHPRGSLIHTSLGLGIVCDTGSFAIDNPSQIDIAVDW